MFRYIKWKFDTQCRFFMIKTNDIILIKDTPLFSRDMHVHIAMEKQSFYNN